MQVEIDEGPPVPPPVRRRRRRRRLVAGLAVLLVVAVPVGLAVAGALGPDPTAPADEGAAGGDAEAADPPDGSEGPDEPELVPPEPDDLSGADERFARLLLEVDAAERVMMRFQDDLLAELGHPQAVPDAGDLLVRLAALADDRRDELLVVRDRLLGAIDEPAAEEVRAAYLLHLDAWADYLEAVAEDPLLVLGQGGRTLHTLAINTTADAFARLLAANLPDDVDPEVRRFADGILDRGFRGRAEATV